jgi:hypothetical protein
MFVFSGSVDAVFASHASQIHSMCLVCRKFIVPIIINCIIIPFYSLLSIINSIAFAVGERQCLQMKGRKILAAQKRIGRNVKNPKLAFLLSNFEQNFDRQVIISKAFLFMVLGKIDRFLHNNQTLILFFTRFITITVITNPRL